jgi:hypothetical protein
MIADMEQLLIEQGLNKQSILYEKWDGSMMFILYNHLDFFIMISFAPFTKSFKSFIKKSLI